MRGETTDHCTSGNFAPTYGGNPRSRTRSCTSRNPRRRGAFERLRAGSPLTRCRRYSSPAAACAADEPAPAPPPAASTHPRSTSSCAASRPAAAHLPPLCGSSRRAHRSPHTNRGAVRVWSRKTRAFAFRNGHIKTDQASDEEPNSARHGNPRRSLLHTRRAVLPRHPGKQLQ